MSGEEPDPDSYGGSPVTLTICDTDGEDTLDLRWDAEPPTLLAAHELELVAGGDPSGGSGLRVGLAAGRANRVAARVDSHV